jgi:hypothetical protein
MEPEDELFTDKAIRLVAETCYTDQTDVPNLRIVWFSKTLLNWKAMVADIGFDGNFHEVTYNGVKSETYIDTYVKLKNICVPDSDN